jgi:hypothetical protein
MFASIELKMSRRWSFEDYEVALEKQLVGQYMRHNKATTGFLIIVLQEARTWNAPEGGKKLDFEAVLTKLRGKALALESKNRQRYLRVIGIDATKPNNFRVVAARAAKSTKISIERKSSKAPSKRAVEGKKTDNRATKGVAASVATPREKDIGTTVSKSGRKLSVAKNDTKAS